MAEAMDVTEDAASGRAAQPDGTALHSIEASD
jgi:hypothetical protein